jgi:hypothetical protein
MYSASRVIFVCWCYTQVIHFSFDVWLIRNHFSVKHVLETKYLNTYSHRLYNCISDKIDV